MAAFLDELTSGLAPLDGPGLGASFGITPGLVAGVVLGVSQLSMLLEVPILARADRGSKRPYVLGGLVAMAAGCFAVALAPTFWVLLGAVLLLGPAVGCGVGLAQAVSVDAAPHDAPRFLARWSIAAAAGDLAAPLLLSAVTALGGGWRAAFAIAGAAVAAYAFVLARRKGAWPAPAPASSLAPEAEAPAPAVPTVPAPAPARPGLRAAFANRRLLLWSLACFLCVPMDEIIVAFGAVDLQARLGADTHARDFVLGTFVAGSIAGLLACERLLARVAPLRLLLGAAAGAALSFAAWLLAPSIPAAAAAAAFTGFFAAAHYPIAAAQAYAAHPGASGAVGAVGVLFTPLEVALPFGLAAISAAAGPRAAMLVLFVQPAGLAAIAAAALLQPICTRRNGAAPPSRKPPQ